MTKLTPIGTMHPGMPLVDYLARDAYGSSDLAAFRQGPPSVVPWRRANRIETKPTVLGSAAHCLIIEPNDFERLFYVKGADEAFRTKEAKLLRDELKASGVSILSQGDGKLVRDIAAAFRAKTAAFSSLTLSAEREVSMFWTCPHSGLPRRDRPDWFDTEAAYDLKIVREASGNLERLRWAAYRNGWMHQLSDHRAGVRYCAGLDIKVGRLVCISPTPPHTVWLLEVSEADLDLLALENENTAKEMAACRNAGVWPGTSETWAPCPMPAEHVYTEDDDEEDTPDVAEEEESDHV